MTCDTIRQLACHFLISSCFASNGKATQSREVCGKDHSPTRKRFILSKEATVSPGLQSNSTHTYTHRQKLPNSVSEVFFFFLLRWWHGRNCHVIPAMYKRCFAVASAAKPRPGLSHPRRRRALSTDTEIIITIIIRSIAEARTRLFKIHSRTTK